ncbi:hypothetical protein FFF34_017880 [Inquilinus sp. KBS0705]|nr:hypothetical protein FFF34_017880 [Inquilinus sp. KBS0705]
MKNLIKGCLFFVLLLMTVTGCKNDPPVYPAGLLKTGTITYTLNGPETTIVDNVYFDVILPGIDAPKGNTQILGGTNADNAFTIQTAIAKTGTSDIDYIQIGHYTGTVGSVVITSFSTTDGKTGNIQGTFTADLVNVDTDEVANGVTGTFNITQ